ncbi:Transcriptional regulatory protein ZraR [Polystyrenella longa]|uniref:Transcriptional regulatory protein ZraR n=1 Tax=Polystyrenella longa TaxID=2528007 RepID=A0A518CKL8_9PLAN|nr:sigma 54-interacting transcriptional regulator [Polystyrenella longa]QDU79769.1 Transcriptional regulatory protein ZraR [Polystyrenella longa]
MSDPAEAELNQDTSIQEDVAYLVARTDGQWRDIYKMNPAHVMSIGRANTNKIVVDDEVCSRRHCEVFRSGDIWFLRDLGSRNGTMINGVKIQGDKELKPGSLIQIGGFRLGFTLDVSDSLHPTFGFPYLDERPSDDTSDTVANLKIETGSPSEFGPEILKKQRESRYRNAAASSKLMRDRASRELASLYRLALNMGMARSVQEVCALTLKNAIENTSADQGAILLLPEPVLESPEADKLSKVVSRSESNFSYQMVSEYLAGLVLNEREAVLGRDIDDDSKLSTRDHLGKIRAQSLICAAICKEQFVYGLIHLYSTDPDNEVTADDLEFTLAIADQTGVVLDKMQERDSLEVGLERARTENISLKKQLQIENELVGNSRSMEELRKTILRIGPTDATVLIRGESGVGKELVAGAVHSSSGRTRAPYVCMNCAALSESLLESELFGHEKGSFTGATSQSTGKFEQANMGTLFLDEVGEMSQSVQAKFLRVLEGHPFERVGGRKAIKVDVRVVAATNRDLEDAVKNGTFRQDLYFRLHVVELLVPPLRERKSDIPILAHHFLKKSATRTGRDVRRFSHQAMEYFLAYEWPGNVRELQNVVERTVIMASGEEIKKEDIHLSSVSPFTTSVEPVFSEPEDYTPDSLEDIEQRHILATLEETNWNKSHAASILGVERSTLDRKLKKYGVKRPGS